MKRLFYLFVWLTLMTLIGCNNSNVSDSNEDVTIRNHEDSRFEVVYKEYFTALCSYTIILDKQTGTKYLFVKYDDGAGLTQLQE